MRIDSLLLVGVLSLGWWSHAVADDTAAAKRLPTASETRSVTEIHRDLLQLERGTAKAANDADRAENIARLCALFVEIGEHSDLTSSAPLQRLSVRLRSRLKGIERRTVAELKRRRIPEPEEMVAQQRQERQNRYAGHRSSKSEASSVLGDAGVPTSKSASESESGERVGQPDTDSATGTGHFAPGPDYGWDLVNLIRMTIRPDYWAVAGGPGKALYYGNSRALVIHGSWRVQEDVADLLTALRGG